MPKIPDAVELLAVNVTGTEQIALAIRGDAAPDRFMSLTELKLYSNAFTTSIYAATPTLSTVRLIEKMATRALRVQITNPGPQDVLFAFGDSVPETEDNVANAPITIAVGATLITRRSANSYMAYRVASGTQPTTIEQGV